MSSGKLEIKETCCPKMGIIKDTKVRDLDAKGKRWKDTDELYKKIQMNPIPTKVWSATQPDILECEVKWALASTAINKASGGDEILAKLFKIPNMMLLKCRTQHVSTLRKPSSGHRTGKGQSSSQFPSWGILKNVQTTGQLCSSPISSKSSK